MPQILTEIIPASALG